MSTEVKNQASNILKKYKKGVYSLDYSINLLNNLFSTGIIDDDDEPENLCRFSGTDENPELPTKICIKTNGKRRGTCSTCNIATEWKANYNNLVNN